MIRVRGAALPAALAATAEAGLGFLPGEVIARNSPLHATGGPLVWYPLFVALVAAGTAAATHARHRRGTPALILAGVVATVGLQVAVWGRGGLSGVLVAGALCLFAGARVATLAFRDWRDPIASSFGWGAVVLLAEIPFVDAAGWGAEVWPIVVVFFAASLASRAASVRLAESADWTASGLLGDLDPTATLATPDVPPEVRRRWRRVFAAVLAGAVLAIGVGLLLGMKNGPIEPVSRLLILGVTGLLFGVAFVVSYLLRPIEWLLNAFGLNGDSLRSVLARLRHNLGHARPDSAHRLSPWGRLFGLTVGVLIVTGLVMVILRQRRKAREAVPDRTKWVEEDAIPRREPQAFRRRRRPRRELPEDAVRRLYAEALIELEKRGRPRPASATPGEFLHAIRENLPECAAGFGVLTRAYEDVRYGRLTLGRDRIDSLEAESLMLARSIRRAPLPEAAEDEDSEAERIAAARGKGADLSAPSTDDTFRRR